MLNLEGYVLVSDEVASGSNCLVYKCKRVKDDLPVRIKVLNVGSALPMELSNFRYEQRMVQSLSDIQNVIKVYDIISTNNTEGLVLEDFGGEALSIHLGRDGSFSENIRGFLELAINICDVLHKIHLHNVVHKDIKVLQI